jgi:hypothetical protein
MAEFSLAQQSRIGIESSPNISESETIDRAGMAQSL